MGGRVRAVCDESVLVCLSFSAASFHQKPLQMDARAMNSQTGVIAVKGAKLQYVAEGTGVPCIVVGSSIMYPRLFAKELREHLHLIYFWICPISCLRTTHSTSTRSRWTLMPAISNSRAPLSSSALWW